MKTKRLSPRELAYLWRKRAMESDYSVDDTVSDILEGCADALMASLDRPEVDTPNDQIREAFNAGFDMATDWDDPANSKEAWTMAVRAAFRDWLPCRKMKTLGYVDGHEMGQG